MKQSSSVNVKSILFLRAYFATSQISCFVVIVMARSRRKEESLDMFSGAHFQLIVETWRDTNVEFEIRIRYSFEFTWCGNEHPSSICFS